MPHIYSRDQTQCLTVEGGYNQARDAAIKRNWVILTLGWCPVCRYLILHGDDGQLHEYPAKRTAV